MHCTNDKGAGTANEASLQPWQAREARAVAPEDGVVGDKVREGTVEEKKTGEDTKDVKDGDARAGEGFCGSERGRIWLGFGGCWSQQVFAFGGRGWPQP